MVVGVVEVAAVVEVVVGLEVAVAVVAGDKGVVVLVLVMLNKEALAGDLAPRKQLITTDGGLEILVVGELTL